MCNFVCVIGNWYVCKFLNCHCFWPTVLDAYFDKIIIAVPKYCAFWIFMQWLIGIDVKDN
jgi:hypothetical protein